MCRGGVRWARLWRRQIERRHEVAHLLTGRDVAHAERRADAAAAALEIEQGQSAQEQLAINHPLAQAHRDPEAVREYSLSAEARGLKLVIAGAGKAAALPGVVASMTDLPVIGVPIRTSDLGGLDSLLSMVQMPAGVPVATVAINGARNAGILAAKILRIAGLAPAAEDVPKPGPGLGGAR